MSFHLLSVIFVLGFCCVVRAVFDYELYESVLDREACNRQLQYLTDNTRLLVQFLDAGYRTPRGILTGNLADWGNYHQCLSIIHPFEDSTIDGKYCSIGVPLEQNITPPNVVVWPDLFHTPLSLDNETINRVEDYKAFKRNLDLLMGTGDISRVGDGSPLSELSFAFGICVPKVCNSTQIMEYLLGPIRVHENFCRLPNDKPFSTADYIGIISFSIIALLIMLSTAYDLQHTLIRKKDPKEASTLFCCFSMYTNTRRLLKFSFTSDSIHCIDGIRSISMLWVIVGHSFLASTFIVSNPLSFLEWSLSYTSVWLTSAPISVDTFFLLSGLLLVYTTAGKLSTKKFLKNLHLFYLLRYFRLFPMLAAAILFHASVFHHFSDGPNWDEVAIQVQSCRTSWWSPLIYLQNYINPTSPCVLPSWYLYVDMQLHWVSPLVLVWVLTGKRRAAWTALSVALVAILVASTTFNVINEFPAVASRAISEEKMLNYYSYYYSNTLTRGAPFFVGMMMGYLLHLFRGNRVQLPLVFVLLLWLLSLGIFAFVIFITIPVNRPDFDNQMFDNFINSFMRPLWAAALGWLIFACQHGYGGPVNWFLSLNLWKLPSRLSYAMYLFHFPLLYIERCSLINQIHFSAAYIVFRSLSDIVCTLIISVIVTLAFDSPLSTIQKLILGANKKSQMKNSDT